MKVLSMMILFFILFSISCYAQFNNTSFEGNWIVDISDGSETFKKGLIVPIIPFENYFIVKLWMEEDFDYLNLASTQEIDKDEYLLVQSYENVTFKYYATFALSGFWFGLIDKDTLIIAETDLFSEDYIFTILKRNGSYNTKIEQAFIENEKSLIEEGKKLLEEGAKALEEME